jgi:hypothetical protein
MLSWFQVCKQTEELQTLANYSLVLVCGGFLTKMNKARQIATEIRVPLVLLDATDEEVLHCCLQEALQHSVWMKDSFINTYKPGGSTLVGKKIPLRSSPASSNRFKIKWWFFFKETREVRTSRVQSCSGNSSNTLTSSVARPVLERWWR